MLEQLRIKDDELLQQLALVCRHLADSTRLLEQMLAGGPEDEAPLARAIHESDREAHEIAHRVDARAFKIVILRVDRMDLHALALALDAAVDAVEKAGTHTAALHASGADGELRALAALLTRAADSLTAAMPHLWAAPEEVEARVAEVHRLKNEGEACFDAGIARLFAGVPNAVEVLRWKDVHEMVWHALGRCTHAADALNHLARESIR